MNTIGKILVLLVLVMGLYSCGPGRVVVTARPEPPVYVRPEPPHAGWVWVDGDWYWRSGHYVYKRGYWVAPRPAQTWVPGHWERHGSGWFWRRGHWSR